MYVCTYVCTCTYVSILTYVHIILTYIFIRLDEFQQFYDIQGLSWSRVRMNNAYVA